MKSLLPATRADSATAVIVVGIAACVFDWLVAVASDPFCDELHMKHLTKLSPSSASIAVNVGTRSASLVADDETCLSSFGSERL